MAASAGAFTFLSLSLCLHRPSAPKAFRSLTDGCMLTSLSLFVSLRACASAVKESVVELLRTKLFLRGKAGVEALWGLPSSSKESGAIEADPAIDAPAADMMEFSADGSKIVLVNTQTGFVVRDTERCVLIVVVTVSFLYDWRM